MKKIFHKIEIEDVQNENFTEKEVAQYLDIFKDSMKAKYAEMERQAYYSLQDPATSEMSGRFILMRTSENLLGQEWEGDFKLGTKRLKVIGTLAR